MGHRCGRCQAIYFQHRGDGASLPDVGCPSCGAVGEQAPLAFPFGITYVRSASLGFAGVGLAFGGVTVAIATQQVLAGIAGVAAGTLLEAVLLRRKRPLVSVMPGYLHWSDSSIEIARSFAPAACVSLGKVQRREDSHRMPQWAPARDWEPYAQIRGWRLPLSPLLTESDADVVLRGATKLLELPPPALPPDVTRMEGSAGIELRWGTGRTSVAIRIGDDVLRVATNKSELRLEPDDLRAITVNDGSLVAALAHQHEQTLLEDSWPDRLPLVAEEIRRFYRLKP